MSTLTHICKNNLNLNTLKDHCITNDVDLFFFSKKDRFKQDMKDNNLLQ